jgi:hypothetical protein
MPTMEDDPVLIYLGGAAAVIAAGLIATNALGWSHLDASQLGAIAAFVIAFTGLLAAGIRGQVYSPATHEREVAEALATPTPLPHRQAAPGSVLFGSDPDEA